MKYDGHTCMKTIMASAAICIIFQGCSMLKKAENPSAMVNKQTNTVETQSPKRTDPGHSRRKDRPGIRFPLHNEILRRCEI